MLKTNAIFFRKESELETQPCVIEAIELMSQKEYDELSKGLQERRLTPRECALIQTFPPDYEFVIENKVGRKGSFLVSPSQAYKIIGNAVPPLLAYNLAKRIEEVWGLYFKKSNDNIR